MNQFFQVILVVNFVLAYSATLAQKPQIVFDKLEHNFGTFSEADGVQLVTFKFTNKGKVPLILNSVRASCGCTTPKWTKEPVLPDGSGEIQVGFDPKNQRGAFNKTVVVASNA